MKLRSKAVDTAYWFGWNVLWVLPGAVNYRIFDLLGKLSWRFKLTGTRQLELNLSRTLDCDPTDERIRPLSRTAITVKLFCYHVGPARNLLAMFEQ